MPAVVGAIPVRHAMADQAAGCRAKDAVMDKMSGDAADDRSFDAAAGIRRSWRCHRRRAAHQGGRECQGFHIILLLFPISILRASHSRY
jgi:hypothetical protein